MVSPKIDYKTMKLADLKPAPYNPRVELKPGMPEYEKLKRSLSTFGLVEPVIVNKRTGYVVGGHQRLGVLRDLGYDEVKTVVIDVSEAREKLLNVALNKISGDWDLPKLRDLLGGLNEDWEDVTLSGFDDKELAQLLNNLDGDAGPDDADEDNYDPDEGPQDPITKAGELWQLGRHRLKVGDATKPEDVDAVMAGELADMVFTDPPYNVAYEGHRLKRDSITNDDQGDDQGDDEFAAFLANAFSAMLDVAKPGAAAYVFHPPGATAQAFMREFTATGWLHKQTLIWVKDSFVIGRQDYKWQHESILYGWKAGGSHHWYGNRKSPTTVEGRDLAGVTIAKGVGPDGCDVVTMFNGEQTVTLHAKDAHVAGSEGEGTVWRVDRPKRSKQHPTMKPVKLIARGLRNSSKPGDVVLDPFGGSGTTLIACEQMARDCRMIEKEPHYADVIIRRWEALTGEKAMKL